MLCGYQAVYDADFFDAIDYAAANRFDYVAFDLNVPRFYIDRLDVEELDRLRQYAEGKEVGLAFHLPGDNVSLYADYPAIRRGILDHFTAVIAAAERLHARHVTVHAGIHPALKQANAPDDHFLAEYREYFGNVLYENLAYLAAQTTNVLLCVENYHFTPLTMQVVEKLLTATDRLFLTWDIAKGCNAQAQPIPEIEDFLRKHRNRLREIHAHDIIVGFRSHQIIGDGNLDFHPYTNLYHAPHIAVTIEVRPRDAARLSRERLLQML